MKPRKMQPRVMWAVVNAYGQPMVVVDTRLEARTCRLNYPSEFRVVRVRVTEAQ